MVTTLTNTQNKAGIFTYLNEYNHNLENVEFIDIWLNDLGINSDNYILHIDLGLISEDANKNALLDSEEDYLFGNGIIEENEDTGLDGCFDYYEDGKGGCLELFEIEGALIELTYGQILENYPQFLDYIYVQEDWENENTYCPTCTIEDPI